MRELAIFGPHPGDPLTRSHFRATRQQATTRGKATFSKGGPDPELDTSGGRVLTHFFSPLGDPHHEPFWATRQQATTRGEDVSDSAEPGASNAAETVKQGV